MLNCEYVGVIITDHINHTWALLSAYFLIGARQNVHSVIKLWLVSARVGGEHGRHSVDGRRPCKLLQCNYTVKLNAGDDMQLLAVQYVLQASSHSRLAGLHNQAELCMWAHGSYSQADSVFACLQGWMWCRIEHKKMSPELTRMGYSWAESIVSQKSSRAQFTHFLRQENLKHAYAKT